MGDKVGSKADSKVGGKEDSKTVDKVSGEFE